MKLILILLYFVIGSINISLGQNNLRSYTVLCELKGLPDSLTFYLIRLKNLDTVKKVVSINGRIIIEGEIEDAGELHFLAFDSTQIVHNKFKQNWIRLYLTSGVYIKGNMNDWPNVTLLGTPSTLIYNKLVQELFKLNKDEFNSNVESNWDSLTVLKNRVFVKGRVLDLLMSYPDEYSVADLAKNSNSLDYAELRILYGSLSERVRGSYPGRILRNKLNVKQQSVIIALNNRIPAFHYLDSLGLTHSIQETISHSKLTLIDFWASWCKPCIEEFPRLDSVQNRYSKCDFQVISISIDRRREDWIKSLNILEPKWIQGLDLNGSVVKTLFGIRSIPAYLLVDREGRMIAFYCGSGEFQSFGPYIRGEELDETLTVLINSDI